MATAVARNGPQRRDVAAVPVNNPNLLIAGVMLASLIQVLDTTIANVAIPHMQTSLGATSESVTWVLTSYIIAAAVAMPLTGWLANKIGARELFLASVVGFIISSMLCGLSQNLAEMVIFRAMQGVSGAFIAPLSQSFMLDSTPPSKHPQMMSIWGMGVIIGPVIGPVLGGWLTENWDWRFVFYVNLPLGLIALALMYMTLPQRPKETRRFDMFGFIAVAVGLTSMQMMLDRGQHADWFDSLEIWIYAGIMASAVWIAIIHLTTSERPLFPRALFADRNYVIALFFMLLMGLIIFATMALLPPMLQHLFGYSVIDTGMVLMPRGIGVMLMMPLAGYLVRSRVDARLIVATGFAIVCGSLWEMAHWSLAVDTFHIVVSGVLQGLGIGLVFLPLNTIAFATLAPRLRTDGSSLLNLSRSIGSSVGISAVTVMITRNSQISHSDLASQITASDGIGFIDLSSADRFQGMGDTVMAMLNGEITRQASMISYIDVFYAMLWVTAMAVPFLLFMKPSSADTEPAQMGH
ncbi:DHA2 family efflux MFS transporter permease subunit [Croceicoccus naphthovorans]|uniref:DSBA oxidoreductase n=1 Tax=Croceicoccus naphthovorans TaxID=1348774 RepID=A0A0G3XBZ7_9SPHN|nr:DHA2 family efflux MFS transporter permease subunit [Croceicoccus naphthovorans]AKM09050.1 DSBA oxidoreductase [Croceicoccus naphthovorans]MBB3991445.1 DHA2 family multidrug resistance protein [Croceicoccus naphthovorans]